MSTVPSDQVIAWHERARVLQADIASKRQALRADPSSGEDDPMRTGLDAAFDSLSTTLSLLHHLWFMADIPD